MITESTPIRQAAMILAMETRQAGIVIAPNQSRLITSLVPVLVRLIAMITSKQVLKVAIMG